MSGLDYRGILENAGADPHAPEGSQQWALAQVAAEIDRLRIVEAGASLTDLAMQEQYQGANDGR